MRKTLFLLLIVSSLFTLKSSAQSMGSSYQTALGVKFWPGTISLKHFTSDNTALEGMASFWNGFRFTGLYEIHGDINDVAGLKWYVGPGAHLGWYNGTNYHDHYYGNGDLSIGVDGVLGLDYKFDGAPINVSLDVQPYLELNHVYLGVWGGLAVRYTF